MYHYISTGRDGFDILVYTIVRMSDEKVMRVGIDSFRKLRDADKIIGY